MTILIDLKKRNISFCYSQPAYYPRNRANCISLETTNWVRYIAPLSLLKQGHREIADYGWSSFEKQRR